MRGGWRRALAWGTAVAVAGGAVGSGPATAQVKVSSGAAEVGLGGRFQLQARTSSCGFPAEGACAEQAPEVDLLIRRARLTFDVRVDDLISGRLEPDFSDVDGVELKDAWGRLTFNPSARLTAGHQKRPFDGFQLTSSTQILTIERDLDVPGVPGLRAASLDELTTRFRLSDRDVGVMLDGVTPEGRFRYWVGVFNGGSPTDNEDVNTEKQLLGRGQVRLDAGGRPLRLAAAGALTDVPFTRASGERAAEYFWAAELWGEWGDFDGGPHVQAGLLVSENPFQDRAGGPVDLEAGRAFGRAHAWQVIGTYKVGLPPGFTATAVEPLLRLTRADPNADVDGDASWGVTPGVQLFLHGRNKVAVNWDVALFQAEAWEAEHSLKLMYFFHF